jgi:hypothetical protein
MDNSVTLSKPPTRAIVPMTVAHATDDPNDKW